jgi:hypothetical protein
VLVDPECDHAQTAKLTLDVGVLAFLAVEERLDSELDELLRRVLVLVLLPLLPLLLLLPLLPLLPLPLPLLLGIPGAVVAPSAPSSGIWCTWWCGPLWGRRERFGEFGKLPGVGRFGERVIRGFNPSWGVDNLIKSPGVGSVGG